MGQTGANAQVAGKAYGDEWCVGFVQTVRKNAGLSELANGTLKVRDLRSWAKSTGRVTSDPQAGDVFTVDNGKQRHAAIVASRVGNRVTTIGGNEGAKNNYASQVKEGASYNINAPGVMFIRPEDAARTSQVLAKAPVDPRQNWSLDKQQKLIGADGFLPWERAQNRRSPVVVTTNQKAPAATGATTGDASTDKTTFQRFDPRLLTGVSLPKSFGPSMADYHARPGESTSYRQTLESMIVKLMQDGVQVPDKNIRSAGAEAKRLDLSKSTQDATQAAYRSMADMSRQIRAIGHENNPYFALLEEFKSGEAQFATHVAQNRQLGATLSLMKANISQGTKDIHRDTGNATRSASENNALLGESYDPTAYSRAQFATQKRFEIWNSPDIVAMTQVIAKLRAEGDEHKALQLQKELNAQATTRLTDSMRAYGAEQAATALKGNADELKRLRDEASMLEFIANLRKQGLSDREVENQGNRERARRSAAEQLAPSLATGTGTSYLHQLADGGLTEAGLAAKAAGTADAADQNTRTGQTQSDEGALRSYNDTVKDNIALIQQQQGLYALFGSDSPQLQIDIELLKERSRLMGSDFKDRTTRDAQGNLTLDPAAAAQLKQRLNAKAGELEAQRQLDALIDSRRGADAAEIRVLEMKKDAAQQLATTERERLQIQFDYDDALKRRADPSYQPSDREKAAREGQLGETDAKSVHDATLRAGEAAQNIFRDSISQGTKEGLLGGLEGLGQRIQQAFLDAQIDKISRQMAGVPADPNAVGGGSLLGAVFGRRSRGGAPTGAPITVPFSPTTEAQPPSYVQGALNSGGLGFGSVLGRLGNLTAASQGASSSGPMSAGSVVINTGTADIKSGVTNVSGGLFGGMGNKGGGPGTSPGFDQMLKMGWDVAGPRAKA